MTRIGSPRKRGPGRTAPISAVRPIVDNILETFKEPSLVFDINIRIELSLGIATYEPGSDLTLQALLKRADIALYEAKGTGRNIYRIFGES